MPSPALVLGGDLPAGTDRPDLQGQPRDLGRPRHLPVYLDASALVKLAKEEEESSALWTFIDGGKLTSSALALTEVPRALKREADAEPMSSLRVGLGRAAVILSMTTARSVDRLILWRAAVFGEPHLGSLDTIHVVTALALRPIRAFVTYDKRQARAAQTVGLRTVSPGVKG